MKTACITASATILLCLPLALTAQPDQSKTIDRLRDIRFPCVEMKDANAIDVADFLISLTDPNPPFRTSIVLDLEKARDAAAKERASDPRRLAYKGLPKVTITLTNATMLEVVQKLTAAASLSYDITNNIVIIKGPDGRDLKRNKWPNQAFEAIGDPGSPQPQR